MRILQIIPTLSTAGAEKMLASLSVHLRRWGHSVTVAAMYPPDGRPSVEDEIRAAGVEVRFLGKKRGIDVRMIARFARTIAEVGPDVIHSHLHVLKYLAPALASTLMRRHPVPVVHTVHNIAEHEAASADVIVQWLAFRTCVAPVAIGVAVADSIRRLYGIEPRCTIPNGIPVGDFVVSTGARAEVRGSLDVPDGAPVLVSVARLCEQKNHDALLCAFASDRIRQLKVHLVLVGDGPLRGRLEQRARALGIADRVRFLGQRRDIARLLAAADVFVLASRCEGQPLAVMEAMAAGKPVVATAVGSVPELVSAQTGRLVPPGDAAALEAALFEHCRDLQVARVKGSAAQRLARRRFEASGMARAYSDLYAELRSPPSRLG